MWRIVKSLFILFSLIVSACDKIDREHNIIVNKSPFYITSLPYRPCSEKNIISLVKSFAIKHSMDYLGGPGHPTLEQDQFNLTATSKLLNFGVTRVAATLPYIKVYATAQGDPTSKDRALTMELVRQIRQAQGCSDGLLDTR